MKFRKKPVVIEAIQYTAETSDEIKRWLGPNFQYNMNYDFLIQTSEGVMRANVGDWIIRGVKGEFYPCKPDIFDATYEAVEP